MVGGGFAGFALSLVGGRVDGGLLGLDCWRRLAVGGVCHGRGVLLCLLAGLLRCAFGGIEWDYRGWRTRFRVKPVVLAGWLERKQASSGECKVTRAEVLQCRATINSAIIK